jgi:hypothetical protein
VNLKKKPNTLGFFPFGKKGVPGENPWTPVEPPLFATVRGISGYGNAGVRHGMPKTLEASLRRPPACDRSTVFDITDPPFREWDR